VSEHMVLVTGALTGIGLATATAFGRDGASVVVSGRDDEEDEALTAQLRTLGGNAGYLRPDISVEDAAVAGGARQGLLGAHPAGRARDCGPGGRRRTRRIS
jgi:NAD(P)-dependent dehydrogenase (short-subunit alcohol dehydrogenase family)